jgi:hypothetical protein
MGELGERLKNQRDQIETRGKVSMLRTTLESIKKAQGENYPKNMKDALISRTASLAWGEIPEYVAALDLGDGVHAERAEEEITRIPEASRQTWDLERMDQHGAYLSQGLNQEWQPIFPPREA